MRGRDLCTDDYVLLEQFKVWRFGFQTRRTRNEVLDNMLYCEFHRSPREIWAKAEECAERAKNEGLRGYFSRIADKYRTKTIFG